MFQLKVCGYREAEELIQQGWPTYVISLLDPWTSQKPKYSNQLALYFHDVESETMLDWIAPQTRDLEEVIRFTKNLTETDRLLIHCYQGISRSPAVAIGVLISKNINFSDAYHHVSCMRTGINPNKLIIGIIDEYFGLNGELLLHAEAMRKTIDKQAIDLAPKI
jgi:predicted protein tyrosine phosphatase